MSDIPMKVHVSWKRKDILHNQSPLILNGLKNLKDLNPDWTVEISDDDDVERYLKENLIHSDFNAIRDRHVVEKLDLWRLLKIYNEGGLYTDIDRYHNIPLCEIISNEVECVLPTYFDVDFSQDFMLSVPGNPIHKEAIRLNTERRRAGCRSIYYLGPRTYMHAVSILLTGKMVDSAPGPEIFGELREAVTAKPSFRTYREVPPGDTITFRYNKDTFKVGNGKNKDAFYEEFGVRHWTRPALKERRCN